MVGAEAAHRVVLCRTHGDPLGDRIDAEEVAADVLYLAQILFDVRAAEVRDVEPEVRAVARVHALALADVLGHAARHDVARCELFLFRLVIRHEAVAVHVAQQTAIAAAALGREDADRHDRRRVKLHGLHVAERGNAGLEREPGPGAFVDDGVGGDAIQPSVAASSDDRGLGDVRRQLARDQIANDRAEAAVAS
jgi:hypothetical protein